MKRINNCNESFVGNIQDLKNACIIWKDDNLCLNDTIHCALCNNTSDNHDLWFVLIDAGSGSMDDYICSECIKKIYNAMKEEK